MKRTDLTIVGAIAVIGIVIAFWALVISPKRKEAADLQDQITAAQAALDQAQQASTAGEQGRKSFPINYRRLVVLGKATPADGEQASLLVQLQRLAEASGVRFQSIDLAQSTATSSTSTPTTPADTSTTSTTDTSTATSTSTSASATDPTAAATEASAAALPIGASVGPAGLPVMPYDLKFTGNYFQIANFLGRVDGLVHTRQGLVDVHGRLLTVDALKLAPIQSTSPTPLPPLVAELTVNAYLTPADQGITGGATPAGPTPTTATASSTTPDSTSTPAPTAATTP